LQYSSAAIVSAISPLCEMKMEQASRKITGFRSLKSFATSMTMGWLVDCSKSGRTDNATLYDVPHAMKMIVCARPRGPARASSARASSAAPRTP
jgi:hypothetical protein